MLKSAAMMEWLKVHSYLATWMGPAIGVITLILNYTKRKAEFDLRSFTIYLTFFVVMGVKLSNTIDLSKISGVDIIWMMCFWNILWPSGIIPIKSPNKPVDNSAPKSETPTKPPSSQE
jgi:hypothetical protein